MGKKKRLSGANLMHTFRKSVREVERELDDNIADILFTKYFDIFVKLSEDYVHVIVKAERVLYDVNSSIEDKEKALHKYIDTFEKHNIYRENKSQIKLIKNDMTLVETFKGCIFYDVVLEQENMFNDVLLKPTKKLGDIISMYKGMTKSNLFDVERTKYIKMFSEKFTVLANLIVDETVNAYCEEIYKSAERVKTYLDKNFEDEEELNVMSENLGRNIDIIRSEVNYRDLNSLANACDFIKVRQKGSPAQYKHVNGRLITIPQGRVIGKGLSIKIQKDLALS